MEGLLLSKLQAKGIVQESFTFSLCEDKDKKGLYELFLEIIAEGTSYPQVLPYSFEEFLDYFSCHNSKVIICKYKNKEIVGGFYIKPNFPGKSSHIANCGYIVKKEYRRQKIGFHLGKYSIDIAKELGYKAIVFNLVFKENIPSIRLWNKLGFQIIGTMPNAVRMDNNQFQDAHIMFLKL